MTSQPDPSGSTGDAVAVLEGEHSELQELFRRVSSVDEDRAAVLKQLIQTLAAHVTMEKQLVAPALTERGDATTAAVEGLTAQHGEIQQILTRLERRKVNSPDVPELVTRLLDATDSHIAGADNDVLPALRANFSSQELNELGQRMDSDERRLLTHAHPHLPDTGPLAGISRKVAETIDSLRDRSSDIGRTAS